MSDCIRHGSKTRSFVWPTCARACAAWLYARACISPHFNMCYALGCPVVHHLPHLPPHTASGTTPQRSQLQCKIHHPTSLHCSYMPGDMTSAGTIQPPGRPKPTGLRYLPGHCTAFQFHHDGNAAKQSHLDRVRSALYLGISQRAPAARAVPHDRRPALPMLWQRTPTRTARCHPGALALHQPRNASLGCLAILSRCTHVPLARHARARARALTARRHGVADVVRLTLSAVGRAARRLVRPR
jgi:hypothetical protein